MEEQRRSVRYSSRRAIDCRPVSGVRDLTWPATIQDVSRGGIGVTLGRRFECGALLLLQSDNNGHSLLKLVKVRHVRQHEGRLCFLGCAFVAELSADELAEIR